MSDDLLSAFGRKQRQDLDAGSEASSPEDDVLTRPFDEDERASILDAVFDRVEVAATVSPSPETETETVSASADPEPSNVVELASRRQVLIGSLIAVAAAVTLVWWAWPGAESEHVLVASLPDYTFAELGGGIAEQRSEPNPAADVAMPELKLRADSKINWVLTPAKPTQNPIGVALLARSAAGATMFVPRLDVQVSEQGAVRLQGPLDRHVALAVGQWTLTLFIAGPKELPTDAGSASDSAGPWQNLAIRVTIIADE